MPKGVHYCQAPKATAAKEKIVQQTVSDYKSGKIQSYTTTTKSFGHSISCTTIWQHVHNKSKPHHLAHNTQQLLNPDQEVVLENWIKWLGVTGTPLSKRTIAPKVEALCGWKPSHQWILQFLGCHPDCTLGQPSGLDPKCVCAFNYTIVNKHFKRLQNVFDGNSIPLQNLFNSDEIGIQLGSGQKGTGELYFYATKVATRSRAMT
jgi:hypothetical protein